MKRLISIMLVLTMLAGLCSVLVGCREDDTEATPVLELGFYVWSDCHVVANSLITSETYATRATEDKMEHISYAIAESIADTIIADESIHTVLVPGDLSNNGNEASILAAASVFERIERAGKRVFVINGNHDIPEHAEDVDIKITATEFRSAFDEFGYSEAFARDTLSLSYAVSIDDKHTLIAIDDVEYYSTDLGEPVDGLPPLKQAISDSLLGWVQARLDECTATGKTPIVMAHIPVLTHYPAIIGAFGNAEAKAQQVKLATMLADCGANYVFTGHFHGQDVISYTTPNGNVLYDIETASTVINPIVYRRIEFYEQEVRIQSEYTDYINTDYLSNAAPQSLADELSANGLQAYAKKHFSNHLDGFLSGICDEGGFLNDVQVDNELLQAVIDIVLPAVVPKFMNMPFYIKDETTENNVSLERILAEYDIAMPQTAMANVRELVVYAYDMLERGDEYMVDSPEIPTLAYAIMSAFYFLAAAAPELEAEISEAPVLHFDLERLFKQGELECYDSNLLPFVLFALQGQLEGIAATLLGVIEEDFSLIGNDAVKGILSNLTGGAVSDVSKYFTADSIRLYVLLTEGLFVDIAPDFTEDAGPDDNNLVLPRS